VQTRTHDPYRSKTLTVPQLADIPGSGSVDGPVNVLSLVDRYPPWVNAGAEWMLHSIFRRLVECGHRVQVVAEIPEHFAVETPTVVDGVEVFPAGDRTSAMKIAGGLVDETDVIVGHLLWTREVVTLATESERPLLYLLHNDRQIGHWNLTPNNVTALVPNSEWIAETITGFWTGPTFVCRPPVFCDDYAVTSDAAREFVTLVNLIPEKGVETFYEVARYRHRDDFLAVTGAYGHQHRPPPFIANVTLIAPTANMRDDVYAKTRILLMPSWYESWGRVAVEAMAAGAPVIAAPTPGLVEALGDAAIFIEARDYQAWVTAVAKLTDDRKFWKAQQRKGRARAKKLEQVTDGDLDRFESWVRRVAVLAPGRN
jgi:glycosyltransferase involved in cell wall biosynthesis